MRKYLFTIILFSLLVLAASLQFNCAKNEGDKKMSGKEMVDRGKYLVNFGGCNDCHSPKIMTQMGPIPDTTKLLSGRPAGMQLPMIDTTMLKQNQWVLTSPDLTAWMGPWGISYPVNLTPDSPTGIGNWTDELFIKAMRSGKHMGVGRPILPPMPWQSLAGLTDEDLKAILAYLKSLPPINNQVPDPVTPNMIGSKMNTPK